ncbi:hypothetical protein DPEC_G00336540 [Dallia pectoralis]|uniref:Uncharacterized protein n=1 Tax=Dallia pectoralis TaxID=75939 RepID=A0ACC2F7L6_DALPE|nr:hypothetical protein DPEC_G00336540 [Dallia pectoralis]
MSNSSLFSGLSQLKQMSQTVLFSLWKNNCICISTRYASAMYNCHRRETSMFYIWCPTVSRVTVYVYAHLTNRHPVWVNSEALCGNQQVLFMSVCITSNWRTRK